MIYRFQPAMPNQFPNTSTNNQINQTNQPPNQYMPNYIQQQQLNQQPYQTDAGVPEQQRGATTAASIRRNSRILSPQDRPGGQPMSQALTDRWRTSFNHFFETATATYIFPDYCSEILSPFVLLFWDNFLFTPLPINYFPNKSRQFVVMKFYRTFILASHNRDDDSNSRLDHYKRPPSRDSSVDRYAWAHARLTGSRKPSVDKAVSPNQDSMDR